MAIPRDAKEPLAKDVCPTDCLYRADFSTHITCDYILMEGQPRGCDIGDGCTKYKKAVKGIRKKSQKSIKITHAPEEDAEYQAYKREICNHYIRVNYRKGNKA